MTELSTSDPDHSIVETITTLVQDIFPKGAVVRSVGATDSLSDAGVSSLNMVNLMFAVEAAFDIFIPAERVNASSFRSIDSIARMVQAIRSETTAASI